MHEMDAIHHGAKNLCRNAILLDSVCLQGRSYILRFGSGQDSMSNICAGHHLLRAFVRYWGFPRQGQVAFLDNF